jgi:hypothetical protein
VRIASVTLIIGFLAAGCVASPPDEIGSEATAAKGGNGNGNARRADAAPPPEPDAPPPEPDAPPPPEPDPDPGPPPEPDPSPSPPDWAASCGCSAFTATPTGTIVVPAGGNLQAALDAAVSGDELVLEAGATFVGNFVLPVKTGTDYITVRSSSPSAACVRVTPADAPSLARIVAPNNLPAIRTAAGAHHYRLLDLEVTAAAGVYSATLIELGTGLETSTTQAPHDLILDRLYVHADAQVGAKRGVGLNGAVITVQNSWISDIKSTTQDSQAIAGWSGAGTYVIANNYLEAAGENVLFGGADPKIAGLVPTNIAVRFNHFDKPLSWRVGDPSYAGTHWIVKNLFELKNARDVTVEGNLFEHNWVDAQKGFAILFTVRNQNGGAPWAKVADVTFRRNVVRHVGAAINILGHDDIFTSQLTENIVIEDNLFHDVGGIWGGTSGSSGRLFQLVSGTNEPGPSNVTIDHNTAMQTTQYLLGVGGTGAVPKPGFVFTNQVVMNGWGVYGDGATSTATALATNFPGAIFTANALIGGQASSYTAYPGNFFPASSAEVGFVSSEDYALAPTSAYKAMGTDGEDLGADQAYLDQAADCH